MITERVRAQIARDYAAADADSARQLLAQVEERLAVWRVVRDGDRVERAALRLAAGDLARLRDAVELALRDWRDLLVAARDA